jgi:hypothetical protein
MPLAMDARHISGEGIIIALQSDLHCLPTQPGFRPLTIIFYINSVLRGCGVERQDIQYVAFWNNNIGFFPVSNIVFIIRIRQKGRTLTMSHQANILVSIRLTLVTDIYP